MAENSKQIERRGADRPDDLDWESKVLGRVGAHLQQIDAESNRQRDQSDQSEPATLGWEQTVLDRLRQRIEKAGK